jgi:transcriptional regulator with PAS, ATPase and Fis domain
MAGVLLAVISAARSDIPVLIEGESGTGKELIARAIHRLSVRGTKPFVCENCGAMPESLAESELFGHEKGAFTGAHERKPGLFEQALQGTVFLDEVGEMDLSLQRKLLRVLQEREIRRLGGSEVIAVDFRLVSATNRRLEKLVAAGEFREDLYYRLNATTIHVPPLRERVDDIPLLVDHFGSLFTRELRRPPVALTSRALGALQAYRWPGNVRELRNEMWRLSTSEKAEVDEGDLSHRILDDARRIGVGWPPLPEVLPSLEEYERQTVGVLLESVLRKVRGNRAEAARLLGVSRSMLYRRLSRYGLRSTACRDDP